MPRLFRLSPKIFLTLNRRGKAIDSGGSSKKQGGRPEDLGEHIKFNGSARIDEMLYLVLILFES